MHNISAYNHGIMGYRTPNIDRIARGRVPCSPMLMPSRVVRPAGGTTPFHGEKGPNEADLGYLRWYADNLWTFVPAQGYIQSFLATLPDYPFQEGSSLNAAEINYSALKAVDALKKLQTLSSPKN